MRWNSFLPLLTAQSKSGILSQAVLARKTSWTWSRIKSIHQPSCLVKILQIMSFLQSTSMDSSRLLTFGCWLNRNDPLIASFQSKFNKLDRVISLGTTDNRLALASNGNIAIYDYEGKLISDFSTGKSSDTLLLTKTDDYLGVCNLTRG